MIWWRVFVIWYIATWRDMMIRWCDLMIWHDVIVCRYYGMWYGRHISWSDDMMLWVMLWYDEMKEMIWWSHGIPMWCGVRGRICWKLWYYMMTWDDVISCYDISPHDYILIRYNNIMIWCEMQWWFDMLIWYDMTLWCYDMIGWYDAMIQYGGMICWYGMMSWYDVMTGWYDLT